MAIFKCKMCGGSLEVAGETVATCEYCGTQQTLPKLHDERKANLYDRANHFRRNNEFDKAMGIYEQILNEDTADAETYWSLVLCRYGIEYVEDPASRKRVPTVNRAQFTSIFDDDNYKSALQYADGYQRSIYEDEAKTINEIQKGILSISQKEAPFDVFICYKETDHNGRRTPDSVLANDLYHQLTQEGFKVFFARITLEDKLGSAYEPYIFAALNSAKVMVVLGTKPEYLNAVWVKNEWNRYLALIKQGQKKMLIPAYKDMDPYDLPEEFSHLQAQDMSKLGFMQDLIRGIKKIVGAGSGGAGSVPIPAAGGVASAILERGFMALEDLEWETADEFFEEVLNQNAKCAEAYLGKLMAKLQVPMRVLLSKYPQPFDEDNDYEKAVRFGDEKLKAFLEGCVAEIKERNEKARIEAEEKRKNDLYEQAEKAMKIAGSAEGYLKAASLFEKIPDWKDAAEKEAFCRAQAEELRCQSTYSRAMKKLEEDDIGSLSAASQLFAACADYKDAREKLQFCQQRIKELEEQSELERQRHIEERLRRDEEQKAKKKKMIIIVGAVLLAVIAALLLVFFVIVPNALYKQASAQYNEASDLVEHGDYVRAAELFAELGDFEDAAERKKAAIFLYAAQLRDNGNYSLAAIVFDTLGDYKNAAECAKEVKYMEGTILLENGNEAKAAIAFYKAGDYKDAVKQSATLWESVAPRESIGVFERIALGINADGTVIVADNDYYRDYDVSAWSDIITIDIGYRYALGLKSDGTVVAVGDNDGGRCNISDWTNIVDISAGYSNTVGLKADGTVVAVGENHYGQCNVSEWRDIVAVSAGYDHTVGLKADGTVVATGDNRDGECVVSGWADIIDISAGYSHTVGLKSDGTVVAVGDYFNNSYDDVANWTDIVDISAGDEHVIGLKADGTVEATSYMSRYVSAWSNIKLPN